MDLAGLWGCLGGRGCLCVCRIWLQFVIRNWTRCQLQKPTSLFSILFSFSWPNSLNLSSQNYLKNQCAMLNLSQPPSIEKQFSVYHAIINQLVTLLILNQLKIYAKSQKSRRVLHTRFLLFGVCGSRRGDVRGRGPNKTTVSRARSGSQWILEVETEIRGNQSDTKLSLDQYHSMILSIGKACSLGETSWKVHASGHWMRNADAQSDFNESEEAPPLQVYAGHPGVLPGPRGRVHQPSPAIKIAQLYKMTLYSDLYSTGFKTWFDNLFENNWSWNNCYLE